MNPKDIIQENLDNLRLVLNPDPEFIFRRTDVRRSVMVHPEDDTWIAELDNTCFNYDQTISDSEFIDTAYDLLDEANSDLWNERPIRPDELGNWSDNRCETVVNALWPEDL